MTVMISILIGLTAFVLTPPSQRLKRQKVSDEKVVDNDLSEVIESLRMCLQAGLTLNRSFVLLADCGVNASIIRLANSNQSVSLPVLSGMKEVIQDYESGLLISILERGIATGSSIDETLRAIAQHLRADAHAKRIKRIRAVAVKSVLPLGLCFLPAFILVGVIPIAVSLGSSLVQ